MQSNRQLRDTIDSLNETGERNETDLYHLQIENRDLRDRIEILESVIASTTQQSDFDALDWRQLLLSDEQQKAGQQLTPALKSSNNAINEMATELIEQKKANRQIQSELDLMKVEMMNLQSAHS